MLKNLTKRIESGACNTTNGMPEELLNLTKRIERLGMWLNYRAERAGISQRELKVSF